MQIKRTSFRATVQYNFPHFVIEVPMKNQVELGLDVLDSVKVIIMKETTNVN